ncbi:MAG: DUF4214 domain-containing protein [Pseudomonadota bacterium]
MPSYDKSSPVLHLAASSDFRIAALEGNPDGETIWASHIITYSFPGNQAHFDGGLNYGHGEVSAGWFPLSAQQQLAVRHALDAWSAVAQVTFVEVPDGLTVGDLRFAFSSAVSGTRLGQAYQPSDQALAGDVWLNATTASQNFERQRTGDETGARNFLTLLHEIGHAIGLSHPFAKDGETRGTAPLLATDDTLEHSIMSYAMDVGGYNANPSTPMPYDILAIQSLYGANMATHAHDDVYAIPYDLDLWQPDRAMNDFHFLTLWDAGGNDTLAAVREAADPRYDPRPLQPVAIDLREGHGSSIGYINALAEFAPWFQDGQLQRGLYPSIFIPYGTVIENAIGGDSIYGDQIIGNDANNRIVGGGGADHIDGQGGTDTSAYEGFSYNFKILRTAGNITVQDLLHPNTKPNTPPNMDTLVNIERLEFQDQNLAFDVDGAAGKAYRLYQAAFDRAPDAVGLGFWIAQLDHGMALQTVATAFVASQEFQAIETAAAGSNARLVTQLYANILHRAPDPGGFAFWTGLLDAQKVNIDLVLMTFSESPENQGQLASIIGNGMAYMPYVV